MKRAAAWCCYVLLVLIGWLGTLVAWLAHVYWGGVDPQSRAFRAALLFDLMVAALSAGAGVMEAVESATNEVGKPLKSDTQAENEQLRRELAAQLVEARSALGGCLGAVGRDQPAAMEGGAVDAVGGRCGGHGLSYARCRERRRGWVRHCLPRGSGSPQCRCNELPAYAADATGRLTIESTRLSAVDLEALVACSAEAACLASPLGGGFQPEPETSCEGELVPSGWLRALRDSTPPSQPRKTVGRCFIRENWGDMVRSAPKRRVPQPNFMGFSSRSRKNTQNGGCVPYAGRSLRRNEPTMSLE